MVIGIQLATRRVVRNEKAKVGISQDGRDANQTSPATGHDADVLPRILTGFAFAVVLIVEMSDSFSQFLGASRWRILTGGHADVNGMRPRRDASYFIVDLGCTLAQVGPGLRVLVETALEGALGAPDDAGRGS